MIAIGHLVGYALGSIDLLKVFGTTMGDSQFKQLTLIAAIALLLAVGVTSYAVEERILISTKYVDPIEARGSKEIRTEHSQAVRFFVGENAFYRSRADISAEKGMLNRVL